MLGPPFHRSPITLHLAYPKAPLNGGSCRSQIFCRQALTFGSRSPPGVVERNAPFGFKHFWGRNSWIHPTDAKQFQFAQVDVPFTPSSIRLFEHHKRSPEQTQGRR